MPTRFAKQRFAAPAARLEEHPPAEVERWVGRRAQPKVLVATQTKVVECVVDEAGTYLPSTPCLTVIPTAGASLWDLAAALTSPVMAAWARGEAGGTGLSRETFRLRAKQLQGAPLPGDRATWAVGAALAEELHRAGTPSSAPIGAFRELGQVMNAAYGITDEPLLDWWLELLPRR